MLRVVLAPEEHGRAREDVVDDRQQYDHPRDLAHAGHERLYDRAERWEREAAAVILQSWARRLDALWTTRQLFLERDGEFACFFQNMQLGYREGSLIFVHAGFDDAMAQAMRDREWNLLGLSAVYSRRYRLRRRALEL